MSSSRQRLFCSVLVVSVSCNAFSPPPITNHRWGDTTIATSTTTTTTLFAEYSMPHRTWRRRNPQHEQQAAAQQQQQQQDNEQPLVLKKTKPMPITGYNADAILECYDKRPLEVGWRLNSVGLPLLGWYLQLLGDSLMGVDNQESVNRKRGAELRQHLVRTKSVALIKVCIYILCLCA
jgi:hypothetical protein